jgi:hypothetical protein
MSENLKLIIEKCELVAEDGFLSKLNPKVVMTCDGKKYETKTVYEGGSKPVFKNTFELGNPKDELIEIEVLDVGAISDDTLGTCKICLD